MHYLVALNTNTEIQQVGPTCIAMALSRLLLGVVLLSAAHFVTADDPEASLEGVIDLSRPMHLVMRLTLLLLSLHSL